MEVICVDKPMTYIKTEFIVGKKYTCFKKVSHTTKIDENGTHSFEMSLLDGWYIFDELGNTINAIESCFIP